MNAGSGPARFAHLPVIVPNLATLPATQLVAWHQLGCIPEGFVLYGGTALALRLGHRASEDFDFFSARSFRPTELLASLNELGRMIVDEATPDNLRVTTAGGVHLSFYGGMRIRCVAEPSRIEQPEILVASLFDLAATKAKAILDRAEWKDYHDMATLLRAGLTLPEIIAFATAVFDPVFEFPAAVFLRSLAWFEDGSVPDLPADMKRELERTVVQSVHASIPIVEAYSATIEP